MAPSGKRASAAGITIATMYYLVPCNPNCPAVDKCVKDEKLSQLQGTNDWRGFLELYRECTNEVSLVPDPAFLPTQPAW